MPTQYETRNDSWGLWSDELAWHPQNNILDILMYNFGVDEVPIGSNLGAVEKVTEEK